MAKFPKWLGKSKPKGTVPKWLRAVEVKRVVIYGLVNASDHRDYAVLGEWVFDLYERPILPTLRVELVQPRSKRTGRFLKGKRYVSSRTQYRDPTTGRFVKAPLTGPKPRVELVQPRSKRTGRFLKGKRYVSSRTQYRDPTTGRFVKAPLTGPKPAGGIPDDDQIVADVLEVIESETGHRLFRTPTQREAGEDRVKIGIQHLDDTKRTYTYAEFLRELRHRAHNEWDNR